MKLYLLRTGSKPHTSICMFRTATAVKEYLKKKHKIDKIEWTTNHGSDVIYSYVIAGKAEYATEIVKHTSKKKKEDIKKLYLVEGKCLKYWSESDRKSHNNIANENQVITCGETVKELDILYNEAKKELNNHKEKYKIWKRKEPVKLIK